MKTFPRLLVVTLRFWLVTPGDAAASKPNVIVFLVNDMGWVDCGAYSSKYCETPRIDAFAKRAMRFTDAYAQPLCSPTRVYEGTDTSCCCRMPSKDEPHFP